MPGSGLRVAQTPECVPAGMELGFSNIFGTLCEMGCCQPVGSFRIAVLIKTTADDAGFHPPFVRIDQVRAIAWHFRQKRCGFLVFLELTKVANAQIQVSRRLVPGTVNRLDGAGGLCRRSDHRGPGPVERLGFSP
jgi:hypothetical protein